MKVVRPRQRLRRLTAEAGPVAWWPAALIAFVGATVSLVGHRDFIARDNSIPIADAAGHVLITLRWLEWLQGGFMPLEPFPPAVYLLAANLMRWQEPSWDLAQAAVALHGAALIAGVGWFAARAAGPLAGITAVALAFTAPFLTATSRLFLLDIPATAAIVWVWALCWESRGFSRWLPTLLLGPALAWGALCKYTLLIWVVPVLLFHGVWLLVRRPSALFPLFVAGAACAVVLDNLIARATNEAASLILMPSLGAAEQPLLLAVVALTGTLAIAFNFGERARGLRDGAALGLTTVVALAMMALWAFDSGFAVWVKLKHEAIDVVRSAGQNEGRGFALALIASNWPLARVFLGLALVFELVAIASARLNPERWMGFGGQNPKEWWPGPVAEVGFSSVLGVIVTAEMLPLDARYYLPVVVGSLLITAIGLSRLPRLNTVVCVAVLGLSVLQFGAARGLPVGGVDVEQIDPLGLDPFDFERGAAFRFFVPPVPDERPATLCAEGLLDVVEHHIHRQCGSIIVLVPEFQEGRKLGFEPQAIVALGALRDIDLCVWTWTEGDVIPAERESADLIVIFGFPPETAEALASEWNLESPPLSPICPYTDSFVARVYANE